MRVLSKLVRRVIAPVLILAAPAAASAQTTYTWNQPTTGGSWQTAANWLPSSAAPGVATTDIALFGNAATGANAVTLTGNVSIGELRFDGVTSGSVTAAYTIGTNAQTITVNNGAGGITVSGATATNQTVAANVEAGTGQPLTIINNGGSGVTTLTLSGALSAATAGSGLNVSGWSNTTISGAIGNTIGTLTKDGDGVLTLSAANAYTGGTVINGGRITFTNSNQLGTGAVTLNGGELHVNADINITQNITLGTNGGKIVTTAGSVTSAPTVTGAITGSGPLTIDGGLYLFFTSNQAYTGPTIVNNAGMTLVAGGQMSATSAVTVNGYIRGQIGILSLDNTGGANANRVNDAAPVTLNGGLISIVPGLFSNADETFGNLTVSGFGTLYGNQILTLGGTASMNFGSLTRGDNFSTIYVGGPVTGPGAGTSVKISFTSGISQPGGSGTSIGIIPWVGGDGGGVGTGAPTGFAETLYTYNDTNGLIALNSRGSVNFAQIAAGDPLTSGAHNALTGNPEALAGDVSIRSIVLNPDGSGVSTISGTGTLTISTGAVANIRGLRFNGPTVAFGSNTAYLYLGSNITVMGSSSLTGSAGVVATSNSTDGRNTLILTNTTNPNTFSGGLYLNGTAIAEFNSADTQLGAAGGVISFRGGGLRYIGSGTVSLSTGGVDRPLEMFSAGGGHINVQETTGVLNVPGVLSGPAQMTKQGSGTLILANSANTISGGITVAEGTLAVAGPGSLGSGSVTLGEATFVGAVLRFDGGGTYTSNINNALAGTLDTNGNNVTLSGVISGGGVTLTKTGAGTLTLSGVNTYAGNTTVSAGTLLVANSAGSATGAGRVTVNSGATLGGTGTVGGAVVVNSGGTLRAGGANGLGQLTLRGKATLAAGSSFAPTLAGDTAGTEFGQLVIAAGGAIDLGGATFAPTLAYTPISIDKLFLIDNQNAAGGLTGTFNALNQGDTYTFGNGTTAVISYFGDLGTGQISGGNDLVLHTFVPVPEPATVLGLAALALGGGAMWRRRRGPPGVALAALAPPLATLAHPSAATSDFQSRRDDRA